MASVGLCAFSPAHGFQSSVIVPLAGAQKDKRLCHRQSAVFSENFLWDSGRALGSGFLAPFCLSATVVHRPRPLLVGDFCKEISGFGIFGEGAATVRSSAQRLLLLVFRVDWIIPISFSPPFALDSNLKFDVGKSKFEFDLPIYVCLIRVLLDILLI